MGSQLLSACHICPLVFMDRTCPQVPLVLSVTFTSFTSQLVGVLMATDSFSEHTTAWAMNGWRLLLVAFLVSNKLLSCCCRRTDTNRLPGNCIYVAQPVH